VNEILDERELGKKQEETFLNVQEAAALLNLAVATIYEKTSERLIPHYKHGKKLLFKKSELLAWIELRKRKTIFEIKNEAILTIRRNEPNQKGRQ
jgi:excisionase family DNA binding protein